MEDQFLDDSYSTSFHGKHALILNLVAIIPLCIALSLEKISCSSYFFDGTSIRPFFLFGLIIPHIFMLIAHDILNSNFMLICMAHVQIAFVILASFKYLTSLEKSLRKSPLLMTAVTSTIIGIFLSTAVYFSSGSTETACSSMSCILFMLSVLLEARLMQTWYNRKVQKNREGLLGLLPCMMTLGMIMVTTIGLFIITCTGVIISYDYNTLTSMLYLTTFHVIIILSIESIVARLQSSYFKKVLELKKSFIRTNTHEIRTPLNTAFLGLELLRQVLIDARIGKDVEMLDDIKEACNIALELVNDMLTYDKMEDGILALEKAPVSIWHVVRKAIKPFFIQARQKMVSLFVTEGDIPNIHLLYMDGDINKLSQVIRNLISNALKFTPKNGTVRVKAEMYKTMSPLSFRHSTRVVNVAPSQVEWLKLSVTDSGAGISKENQSKLFKEIIQFNAAKLQKGNGSGLGLWITKGIVDMHGGKISVYSEGEGHGCTFTVEFPVYRMEEQTSWEKDSNMSEISEAMEAGRMYQMDANSRQNSFQSQDIPWLGDDSHTHNMSNRSLRLTSVVISPRAPPPLVSLSPRSRGQVFPVMEGDGDGEESKIDKRHIHTTQHQYPTPLLSKGMSFKSRVIRNGIRILVVDDTAMNRKMVCRLLQNRCEYVVEAEDGIVAVNECAKHEQRMTPFHFILMDYEMPNMNGPTAAKKIRAMGYEGKIIGVTGNSAPSDIHTFISHGADEVLLKPLDVQSLDAALAKPRGTSVLE